MSATVDICKSAARALREAGMEDVTAGRLSAATGADGTVVRPLPARTVRTYFDGSHMAELSFQVVARSLSADEAIDACDAAARVLRGLSLDAGPAAASCAPVECDGAAEELSVDAMRHVWAQRFAAKAIITT